LQLCSKKSPAAIWAIISTYVCIERPLLSPICNRRKYSGLSVLLLFYLLSIRSLGASTN
jgi:hypothetical protein